ncbi:fimbrial-like adhesin [Salmonella enterica subsp. enterica serovar Stanleyville]|uniref:Fimbrial-like adhesin n=2 Tax=Salmonella enterica I TaxID=59201 RepID=A0A3U2TKL1_SALET|nr:fimbrial protein [Salmonella enterica]EAA3660745.1 fimbrial-like adhesin [Salmonella enterica subsp. enterica serovar Stanleyville]EBP9979229.1 fimbrial-like adhesin [Salmonella enterica subsp. enterica]ECK7263574.1 fimbrial-like adhesin [Salmonella enterica subsp. enterica serovar Banana]EBF9511078.1 fimbrial-like adhesin [Salmonella enterica subsp. enterica serovar Stanleyville]EBQ0045091.1 fimbrial-like adhesin [Salmonella enterica subsp. enterica]
MKKNCGLLLSLLFLWLISSSAYAWSVYIGKPAGKHISGDEYEDIADLTWTSAAWTLPNVAAHTESGLREIGVTNPTELNPGNGLDCNYHHDVHGVNLFHGFESAGISNGSAPLWKTNTAGLYLGMEITAINFGTNYYPGTLPFWVDWNGGGTAFKQFDLSFIANTYSHFTEYCATKAWKNGYFTMGGIVLWVKFHLYADDKFKPTTSTLSVTFPTTTGYHFRFKLSDTSIGGGDHKLDYILNAKPLTVYYPTCTASAVTGDGVSGSTVPFGQHNVNELKGNGITKDFSIKLSNCTYIKNVDVKLSSTKTSSTDKSLLSNTLSGASGIGVTVAGEKNPLSASDWMTLIPNDSTSIYHFTNMQNYTYSNIGNPDQVLNFRATLKQDSSSTITPGEFKATGKFTIDYP